MTLKVHSLRTAIEQLTAECIETLNGCDFTAHLYGRSLGIHLQRKQIDLTRRRLLNHVQAPIPVDGEELLHRLAIGL